MIYVNFKKPRTLREFLTKFFDYHKSDNSARLCVKTYTDSECKFVQCAENKYRSFDNILECVNTYFPKVTAKELIHELLTLNLKTKTGAQLYLRMANCSTINKIRCWYGINTSSDVLLVSRLGSQYSWKELLEMLGIKTQEQIYEYATKHSKPNKYDVVAPSNNIMDRVKTLTDVARLGNFKWEDVLPYKESFNLTKLQRYLNAVVKINKISEVLNEGVVFNWLDQNQRKWYPWFNRTNAGWVMGSDAFYDHSDAYLGSGSFYESQEKALYAGRQFLSVYLDYLPE